MLQIIPSGEIFIPYKQSVEIECTSLANPPAIPSWWYKKVQNDNGATPHPGKFIQKFWDFLAEDKINITWAPFITGEYYCMAGNLQGCL